MTSFYRASSKLKNYSFSENAFIPKEVTIPLVQEKDVICHSIVDPGDTISEGDIIATYKDKNFTARIHSPVPGKVTSIESVVNPNGRQDVSIKIKTAGSFSFLGKNIREQDWTALTADTLLDKLSEKGVVNTFNCGKPYSIESQINNPKTTKSLVVRMFDEDPVRLSDSLLSKMFLNEIRTGAYIIAKAMSADGVVFIFDQKASKTLDDFIPLHPEVKTEVLFAVNKDHPVAYNKEIVHLYNKSFKKDKQFDVDVKSLFIDCHTAFDAYNAVVKNTPVISRYIHISGNCIDSSAFLNVRLGTTFKDIVNQLGGWIEKPALIVINGHMSGYSVQTLETPVTKYVKSVSFISKKYVPDQRMFDCTFCGECRDVCPRGLSPDLFFANHNYGKDIPEKVLLTAMDCCECSSCNSVCPSRIPLSQIIDSIKEKLLKEKENENK